MSLQNALERFIDDYQENKREELQSAYNLFIDYLNFNDKIVTVNCVINKFKTQSKLKKYNRITEDDVAEAELALEINNKIKCNFEHFAAVASRISSGKIKHEVYDKFKNTTPMYLHFRQLKNAIENAHIDINELHNAASTMQLYTYLYTDMLWHDNNETDLYYLLEAINATGFEENVIKVVNSIIDIEKSFDNAVTEVEAKNNRIKELEEELKKLKDNK